MESLVCIVQGNLRASLISLKSWRSFRRDRRELDRIVAMQLYKVCLKTMRYHSWYCLDHLFSEYSFLPAARISHFSDCLGQPWRDHDDWLEDRRLSGSWYGRCWQTAVGGQDELVNEKLDV